MPWGRKGSGNRNQLIIRKHSQASFKNILSVTKGKEVSRTTVASDDIKKRWQEYTEELYKKDLHNPDNHDGVITDLEPDILEWKSSGP